MFILCETPGEVRLTEVDVAEGRVRFDLSWHS
jgi:hypothetical protein